MPGPMTKEGLDRLTGIFMFILFLLVSTTHEMTTSSESSKTYSVVCYTELKPSLGMILPADLI
jgi:hypothetical protein